jgi:hypothetical protein
MVVETHTETMITMDIVNIQGAAVEDIVVDIVVDTEEIVEADMEEAVEADIVEGIVEADIAVAIVEVGIAVAIVVATAEADTVVTAEVTAEVVEISPASVSRCFAFRSYVRPIMRIPNASRKAGARISGMTNSTNWKKYVDYQYRPARTAYRVYDPSSCFRRLPDVLLIYAFYA